MLNHFNCWPRADQDITDIDRFFEGRDPEDIDEGDFYGDEAQIIWCSLMGYLQMLKALEIKQRLVLTETIAALSELHIGEEYPDLLQGIVRSTAERLQDGFDVDKFKDHYGSGDQQKPFFTPW